MPSIPTVPVSGEIAVPSRQVRPRTRPGLSSICARVRIVTCRHYAHRVSQDAANSDKPSRPLHHIQDPRKVIFLFSHNFIVCRERTLRVWGRAQRHKCGVHGAPQLCCGASNRLIPHVMVCVVLCANMCTRGISTTDVDLESHANSAAGARVFISGASTMLHSLCLPGTNGHEDSFRLYVLLCVNVAAAAVDCICRRSGAHNPQIRECARNSTYWATHT